MKLKWLDVDDKKGNCYAGVNFRDVRMLTFSIVQKQTTYFDRTGKPGWVVVAGKDPIGTYANKGQAQQAAQRFMDDFIRGLFAHGDK
jgi:hypothetical protein